MNTRSTIQNKIQGLYIISVFWMNKYPNIFVTIDNGRVNLQIYSGGKNDRKLIYE